MAKASSQNQLRQALAVSLKILSVRMNSMAATAHWKYSRRDFAISSRGTYKCSVYQRCKKSGFLNAAICEVWEPDSHIEQNDEPEPFNKWWPEARRKGLLLGAGQVDGFTCVHTPLGGRLEFYKLGDRRSEKAIYSACIFLVQLLYCYR
jgi:hypothetical protein